VPQNLPNQLLFQLTCQIWHPVVQVKCYLTTTNTNTDCLEPTTSMSKDTAVSVSQIQQLSLSQPWIYICSIAGSIIGQSHNSESCDSQGAIIEVKSTHIFSIDVSPQDT